MIAWETEYVRIELDEQGKITFLRKYPDGTAEAVSRGESPLMRIGVGGTLEEPASAKWAPEKRIIKLKFESMNVEADIEAVTHKRYMTFELKTLTGNIDLILWGPFTTMLSDSIGESVGVVCGNKYAVGLQALNMKTVGGWPAELERLTTASPSYPEGRYAYEESVAWPASEGSLLQAFARDRSAAARRVVWERKNISVAPVEGADANIAGSKIALFGCPVQEVLNVIEEIELGEGLPHPTLEGEWAKTSRHASQSYLITNFSEADIRDAVEYAGKAGLKAVYHPGPFVNWGHFDLDPAAFPNGDEGLRACVKRAEEAGIRVGVHTLTNFLTLNDPYVTPLPDARIQTAGSAVLMENIGGDSAEIPVDDPEPFRLSLYLNRARIGDELIEYDAVSESPPWRLIGCRRGCFRTEAAAYPAGETVWRVWDHPYDVFFPGLQMQDEFADRLNRLFRFAGLGQISFDGLEGCYATGHEDYAASRFVMRCYEGWENEMINDASLLTHYLWHVHTRMNWGEPWGAAMREGQLEYRLRNQQYFERNFFPRMLGWFLMRSATRKFEATTLDEIEWMLSKAAGFDAGFALSANMDVLGKNGNADELLEAVKRWESARNAGAFTEEQRERLRDPHSNWHLETAEEGGFSLYPIEISSIFECDSEEQQPGQPGGAEWAFENRFGDQPLRFVMRVQSWGGSGSVKRPSFQIGGRFMLIDTDLSPGEYLVCDGGASCRIYDQNWNLLRETKAQTVPPVLRSGYQVISFGCRFEGPGHPWVEAKFVTYGLPERVGK